MIANLSIDPIFLLIIRLTLGVVFAVAVTHKLREFPHFLETVADYKLAPRWLTPAFAGLVVALEVVTVLALLTPDFGNTGLLLAVGLLLLYALAIGINLLRGRRGIDCGCTVGASEQPISGWLVGRNLLLALCAVTGLQATTRALGLWDYGVATCAACAAYLLYTAVNQLLANAPHLDMLRKRYE